MFLVKQSDLSRNFCLDITIGLHEGGTVTYSVLKITHNLGLSELVLFGLDHRYFLVGDSNKTMTLQGQDSNNFSEDYFGYGQRLDYPHMADSEESYAIARSECVRNGSRIIDVNLDNACNVVERGCYQDVLARQTSFNDCPLH